MNARMPNCGVGSGIGVGWWIWCTLIKRNFLKDTEFENSAAGSAMSCDQEEKLHTQIWSWEYVHPPLLQASSPSTYLLYFIAQKFGQGSAEWFFCSLQYQQRSLSFTQLAHWLVFCLGRVAGRLGPAGTANQLEHLMSPFQGSQTSYRFQEPGSQCCKTYSYLVLKVPEHHFCCILLVKKVCPSQVQGQKSKRLCLSGRSCKASSATINLPCCPWKPSSGIVTRTLDWSFLLWTTLPPSTVHISAMTCGAFHCTYWFI